MRTFVKFLLIALVACLAFGVGILFFGNVTGEEFCPQKFSTRRFSYYQIPFTKIQLTPVTFSKASLGNATLSSHLQANKLLGPTASTLRWDVIFLNQVGVQTDRGDADVLMKYLDQPGAPGVENWLAWTQNRKHSQIAGLFWPVIAKMAEEDLYILMPDVFDMARAAKSPEEFGRRVRDEVSVAIQQFAEAERYRKNPERAQHLDTVALEIKQLQPVHVPESSLIEIEPKNAEAVEAEIDPEDLDAVE